MHIRLVGLRDESDLYRCPGITVATAWGEQRHVEIRPVVGEAAGAYTPVGLVYAGLRRTVDVPRE